MKKRGMSSSFLRELRRKNHLGEFSGSSKKGGNMARRRSHRSRRSSHRYRRSRGGLGGMSWLLGAGLYGAVRQKTSNMLAPVTSKIPLGSISDEVAMLGTAYLAKRFIGRKVPLISDVANAAMIVESARIGEAIVTGQVGLGAIGSSSSGSSVTVVG